MRPGTGKAISLAAAFAGLYLFARYLMPLLFPFLLGTALALGAEPLTAFFQKRLGLPRGISTGISVSMAFCLLALAVLLTAAFFLRELGMLADVLSAAGVTAAAEILFGIAFDEGDQHFDIQPKRPDFPFKNGE